MMRTRGVHTAKRIVRHQWKRNSSSTSHDPVGEAVPMFTPAVRNSLLVVGGFFLVWQANTVTQDKEGKGFLTRAIEGLSVSKEETKRVNALNFKLSEQAAHDRLYFHKVTPRAVPKLKFPEQMTGGSAYNVSPGSRAF